MSAEQSAEIDATCTCTFYVVDYSDPERYHPENVDREGDPSCPFHGPSDRAQHPGAEPSRTVEKRCHWCGEDAAGTSLEPQYDDAGRFISRLGGRFNSCGKHGTAFHVYPSASTPGEGSMRGERFSVARHDGCPLGKASCDPLANGCDGECETEWRSYACTGNNHSVCSGVAWQPGIACECTCHGEPCPPPARGAS